jgi:anti-sigma B factor antagonist
MECNLRSEAGFDVLELGGEVDLLNSPSLREKILSSLKTQKNPLLIDMSAVSYIDSSGIASLVEGFQTAKTANLPYGLLSISSTALQVLTLTRLDKIFSLYDTVQQFQEQIEQ